MEWAYHLFEFYISSHSRTDYLLNKYDNNENPPQIGFWLHVWNSLVILMFAKMIMKKHGYSQRNLKLDFLVMRKLNFTINIDRKCVENNWNFFNLKFLWLDVNSKKIFKVKIYTDIILIIINWNSFTFVHLAHSTFY